MRPKIIQKPYLKTMDYFWGDYTRLWNNFKEIYNKEENGEDKPSRYQLKAGHMQVYFRLVKEAQKKMRAENKAVEGSPKLCAIDPNKPYIVTRSKHVLAKINGVSPDTAKRHIKRLCIAGVISTDCSDFIKHYGRKKRRGEILINPDFLLIYDAFELNYVPVSKFLKTEKCGFQPQNDANCPGVSSIGPFQDSIKNNKGTVDDVEKGVDSVDGFKNTGVKPCHEAKPSKSKVPAKQQQNQEKAQNLGSCTTESPKIQETRLQEHKSSARRPENVDNFAEKRLKYVDLFWNLLVKYLFDKTKFYEGEKINALKIIEKKWFKGVDSEERAEIIINEYRERIKLVVEQKRKGNYNLTYNFPTNYLNPDNPKGFTATKKWLEDNRKKESRKRETRLLRIVDRAIDDYLSNPNLSNYLKQNKKVENYAPELLERFYRKTDILRFQNPEN